MEWHSTLGDPKPSSICKGRLCLLVAPIYSEHVLGDSNTHRPHVVIRSLFTLKASYI